jgi:nucleoside-diphosphate-sugar epimerase
VKRSVAITGVTGYLGSRLESAFRNAGWNVIRLVRSPAQPGDRRAVLGESVSPAVFDGAHVLLHAAYDMRAVTKDDIWRINVAGTETLLNAAHRAAVERIIVLSSMSAYTGTRQRYGRAKLEVETMTFGVGGVALRPGLVVGRNPGGMAGTLAKLIRLPVTPCLTGVGEQFPVLEEDFIAGVLALSGRHDSPDRAIGIAQSQPLPFPSLLRAIAKYVGARPPRLIPIPWRAVDAALRAGEGLGVPLPLRSDSLLGLLEPAASVPNADYWATLGIRIRSL